VLLLRRVDLVGMGMDPAGNHRRIVALLLKTVAPQRWDTSLNVRVVDDSRIVIPQATTGGPWLFFLKSTCKWVDHSTACVDLQEEPMVCLPEGSSQIVGCTE
jgi:hypothetical protein